MNSITFSSGATIVHSHRANMAEDKPQESEIEKIIAENTFPDMISENLDRIEREILLRKKGEQETRGINLPERTLFVSPRETEDRPRQMPETILAEKSTNTTLKSAKNEEIIESPRKGPFTFLTVIEEYEDGSRYEGDKQLDKRHGVGTYYFGDGFKMSGEWLDDYLSGYGCLWKDETLIYEGNWIQSQFHGKGTLYNHQQSELSEDFDGTDFTKLGGGWIRFDGNFSNGMKNGFGTIAIKGDKQFCGNFKNDVVHGNGSFTQKGKVQVGSWKINKLESWY